MILDTLIEYPLFALIVTGVLGLCVGSFLNVVIIRLPRMLEHQWTSQCNELLEIENSAADDHPPNLVKPRSHCPHCGHQITALENIPVLSFLLLGGKCADCGKPISFRYPAVEILTALLSVFIVYQFGVSWQGLGALIITWCLVALCFIDYDHQILPDNITLPLIWLGLIFNLYATFCSLPDAVWGAIAGYFVLWLVYHAFKLLTGKEGMGYGDFKMLAALGAWLGWQMLLPIILLSALSGAIIGIALIALRGRDRNIPIPFGPYLAIAGWVAMLWGPEMVDAYLNFAGLT